MVSLHRSQILRDLWAMQAVAAEFSRCAEKPPPLFELRRVRKAGKSRAIAKRRRILLLFGEKSFNRQELEHSRTQELKKNQKSRAPRSASQHSCILEYSSARVLEFIYSKELPNPQ